MANIAPSLRTRLSVVGPRTIRYTYSTSARLANQGPGTGENFQQANDPTPRKRTPNTSKTNELSVDSFGMSDQRLEESQEWAERQRSLQAPNRAKPWSRNQMPRELAMSGPRFEQTIMEQQPQPYSAMDLIHKQPVRWIKGHATSCDGGGGPLGHPRIFINCDKPQICWCTYCGLPYAKESNRKQIEALPNPAYPLEPTGDPVEIPLVGRPEQPETEAEIHGHYPQLKGEVQSEGIDGQPFAQR